MNERIRELAEQAMVTVPAAEGPLSHTYFDKEKFAELIVAECLVTLDSIVCDTSGERDTLWVARKVVADHFGVEE
jgi:hypothetical protein